ncbi:hypothetical protein BU23DRAFT_548246 [Bimuria novae-zelandiae CBS 107.79]|uniref:Mid2 domain-containing protein n=1 Tax=Bimuria novae-zelandiae CBS 107.79 TaxID=1447943 RepID=A0A6A5VRS2_9PLEO|nr:hypothetical protein BU23DRAFT_548246 [Bimuria novae-zelandiae CBS 107.79]
MRPRHVVSSALLASSSTVNLLTATRAAPNPTITKAPDILLKKQAVDDQFLGWTLMGGGWTTQTCSPGYAFYQTIDDWVCCPTTLDGCHPPIDCTSGSLVYMSTTSESYDFSTFACTDLYNESPFASSYTVCNTALVYENTAAFSAMLHVFCDSTSYRDTYYRERPVPTFTTSSASESSSTSSSTTSESTSSATTSTTESSSGAPTPTPIPAPEKKESKDWIAGAVIGPVGSLAFIVFGAWFFLRRRRNKNPPPPPMYEHYQNGGPGPYPGSPLPPPATFYSPQKPSTPPIGAASHQSWSAPPHLSPQSTYAQEWQPMEGQQVYPGPTPSPIPQNGQLHPTGSEGATMVGHEQRPVSMELEGSGARR